MKNHEPLPKKILFYGDIGVDVIVETNKFPHLGEDTAINNAQILPGGSSANSAVIASHLNLESYYMGLIGEDIFRDFLVQDLLSNKVKLDYVKYVEGKNTLIIAVINHHGERSFLSFRGVNGSVGYGEIRAGFTEPFACVHISGYCLQDHHSKATSVRLVEDAKHHHILLSLDPSYQFSSSELGASKAFISNFDLVIPNQVEALTMTKQKDVRKAIRILREMGVKIAVVKMSENGCLVSYKDKEVHLPAYPIDRMINTIGAGDAFCSGFLSGILNGFSPENAARIGNATANIVLQGEGGHNCTPPINQVMDLIARYDGINLSFD